MSVEEGRARRARIEEEYDIVDGRIRSPGKFEGELVYVPYYWEYGLEGGSDGDANGEFLFNIDGDDVEVWPELRDVIYLRLWEDSQGFVYCNTV